MTVKMTVSVPTHSATAIPVADPSENLVIAILQRPAEEGPEEVGTAGAVRGICGVLGDRLHVGQAFDQIVMV